MPRKNIEFSAVSKDEQRRIMLEEITEEERAGKKYLGTALGRDLFHCIYMGSKYYKGNFCEDVKWYFISNESDEHLEDLCKRQPGSIKVEFYGESKD